MVGFCRKNSRRTVKFPALVGAAFCINDFPVAVKDAAAYLKEVIRKYPMPRSIYTVISLWIFSMRFLPVWFILGLSIYTMVLMPFQHPQKAYRFAEVQKFTHIDHKAYLLAWAIRDSGSANCGIAKVQEFEKYYLQHTMHGYTYDKDGNLVQRIQPSPARKSLKSGLKGARKRTKTRCA